MNAFFKNKYKVSLCIILSLFVFVQTSNAYAHFWWGSVGRAVFGNTVKQAGKRAVKTPLLRSQAKSKVATNMVTALSVATTLPIFFMSGEATASNYEYNEHGAILTEDGFKIYLGRGCEAYSPTYGEGEWGWNSSGFAIVMENGKEQAVVEYDLKVLPDFSQDILNRCKVQ